MQKKLQNFFNMKGVDDLKTDVPNKKFEKKNEERKKVIVSEDPSANKGPNGKIHIRAIDITTNQADISKQSLEIIEGLEVYFPKKPYKVQRAYMEKVIKSMQGERNALLQSPTGTGKTLCLLCSALAWMKKERDRQRASSDPEEVPFRIIYSSRTHTQLQQVMKELKTTIYRPRTLILSSRDNLCVKKELQNTKGGALNSSCASARSSKDIDKRCFEFQNLTSSISRLTDQYSKELNDVEELYDKGRKGKFCPYYYTMKNKDNVDLILLPYNYLLDQNIMRIMDIDLNNTTIIFDEAHNIEKTAEEGSSYELSIRNLRDALAELKKLESIIEEAGMKKAKKMNGPGEGTDKTQELKSTRADISIVQGPINNMIHSLKNILKTDKRVRTFEGEEKGLILNGQEIFELLVRCTSSPQQTLDYSGSGQSESAFTLRFSQGLSLARLSDYLTHLQKTFEDTTPMGNPGLDAWFVLILAIKELGMYQENVVNGTNYDWATNDINHYKIYIKADPEDPDNTILHFWCFAPSLIFNQLNKKFKIRNIILTSGTLAPFSSFEVELNLNFPADLRLSNQHIIDTEKNLLAFILTKGSGGHPLNFAYKNSKDNTELFKDLGQSILNLIRQIPHGVLVFFASYSLLEKCHLVWSKNDDILKRMEEIKSVIKEPKSSTNLRERMRFYTKCALSDKGAILLAVFRGKMSEGLDFTDNLARGVILVGIPFPPIGDRRVNLKKEYLDNLSINKDRNISQSKLSSRDWYNLQAIRAMNQACGRVIRHINDYGAVFFFDERYCNPDIKEQISGWVRDRIKVFDNFGAGYKAVFEFFKEKRNKVTTIEEIKSNFLENTSQDRIKQNNSSSEMNNGELNETPSSDEKVKSSYPPANRRRERKPRRPRIRKRDLVPDAERYNPISNSFKEEILRNQSDSQTKYGTVLKRREPDADFISLIGSSANILSKKFKPPSELKPLHREKDEINELFDMNLREETDTFLRNSSKKQNERLDMENCEQHENYHASQPNPIRKHGLAQNKKRSEGISDDLRSCLKEFSLEELPASGASAQKNVEIRIESISDNEEQEEVLIKVVRKKEKQQENNVNHINQEISGYNRGLNYRPGQFSPEKGEINIDSFNQMENQAQSEDHSRNCPICFLEQELWKSPCNHLACKECWKQSLDEKLECPMCRTRVRMKLLIKA